MAILGVVTLGADSGLAEDAVVNTYAIRRDLTENGGDVTPVQGSIANALISIYNTTPAGTDRIGSTFNNPLANYLSPVLSTNANACSVKLYDISADLSGTPHGSPFYAQAFTLGAPGAGDALPNECSMVLTLEAEGREAAPVENSDGSARPKSRYTGRIFYGPFRTAATSGNGDGRPSNTLADTIIAAFKAADDALVALAGVNGFGVWSRTDAVMRRCDFVSVDNAWDTQRRRGNAPSARRRVAN